MKALLSLADRPTAVFCVSDRTAQNALQAFNEAGLHVPKDIALVGFDDVPEAQQSIPPLTTVLDPKWETGVAAAQLLIDLMNGKTNPVSPFTLVLPTSLVIRASS
jgi:DNA-binding LacI/PurR family transcriptional regulator